MKININNQAKVGLVTVVCLLSQGYIFTYLLKVEPHPLISFIPLLPYIAYIYARGARIWYHDKPIYWIGAILAITILDIIPYIPGRG
jgi:hypothetical protein